MLRCVRLLACHPSRLWASADPNPLRGPGTTTNGRRTQAADQAMAAFLRGVRDLPLTTLTDEQALQSLDTLRAELRAHTNPYMEEVLAEL